MAPQPKPLVRNPDGADCAVASCGACKAKTWLFQLDENSRRSWMCAGSSASAHRTLKAKGTWTVWDDGADLAPLREPTVAVLAVLHDSEGRDAGRDERAGLSAFRAILSPARPGRGVYSVGGVSRDIYSGEEHSTPTHPFDDDARAMQRAVQGLTCSVRVLTPSSVAVTFKEAPGQRPMADWLVAMRVKVMAAEVDPFRGLSPGGMDRLSVAEWRRRRAIADEDDALLYHNCGPEHVYEGPWKEDLVFTDVRQHSASNKMEVMCEFDRFEGAGDSIRGRDFHGPRLAFLM